MKNIKALVPLAALGVLAYVIMKPKRRGPYQAGEIPKGFPERDYEPPNGNGG